MKSGDQLGGPDIESRRKATSLTSERQKQSSRGILQHSPTQRPIHLLLRPIIHPPDQAEQERIPNHSERRQKPAQHRARDSSKYGPGAKRELSNALDGLVRSDGVDDVECNEELPGQGVDCEQGRQEDVGYETGEEGGD